MALSILSLILLPCTAVALSIKPVDNIESLAQSLVGPGIKISNVNYKGKDIASGYFSDGINSGIGIESGIVLTSGFSKNLNSSTNTKGNISGNNKMGGDSNLNTLIPGFKTYDAAVLSFDFVSQGDAAYFNYVFGSEEYPEWVNSSFNDAFGFFVDGENYALIPETKTPVSIDTVNADSNANFYVDNSKSNSGNSKSIDSKSSTIEYDGFTTVLTASLTGLTPGETYNIELAIADAGDYVYDSGVFIQAGSFSDAPKPAAVPEPHIVVLMMAGLVGLGVKLRSELKHRAGLSI